MWDRERLDDIAVLVYQPIVSIREHRVVAWEALLRFRGAGGELLEPRSALVLSAYMGRGVALESWVVNRVLKDIQDSNIPEPIHVNLSAEVLGSAMFWKWLQRIQKLAAEMGEAAPHVRIEVIDGVEKGLLDELARLGVELVLDDVFDSSYPIRQIVDPRFSMVKVSDRMIRDSLRGEPVNDLLHELFVHARAVETHIVLEGVEDSALIHWAMESSDVADLLQGFFFSPGVRVWQLGVIRSKVTKQAKDILSGSVAAV